MDAELEKLVEAGKLTPKAADQLEKLKPGTYCLHKSWGFGQVAEWNLLLNQIVIDFQGKKGHPMQLAYAADHLTAIAPTHFLARKATDLAGIKESLKKEPAAIVRNILESLGGAATQSQISQLMVGDLFNEAEWKRWWTSTTKALKKEGFFHIPTKKTEPIQLRAQKVSRADELVTTINRRQPIRELRGIRPLVVDDSQRIAEMEFTAEGGRTFVLKGLPIRWSLNVPDNLFVFDRTSDPDGMDRYTFYGKGWGHGTGMCQVGSYGMAFRGFTFDRILTHYYTGVAVTRWAGVRE